MSISFLLLKHEDVVKCSPTVRESLELIRKSLSAHGNKAVENPPKPGIHTADASFLHAMPAFLKDHHICGIKWVGGYPGNRAKSLPAITGSLMLNDTETGLPLSLMDATYITGIRTAAVSAIAMEKFAAQAASTTGSGDSKRAKVDVESVLGIVGAGVQGRLHVLFARGVLKNLTAVHVYDPFPAATESFLEQLKPIPELANVKFVVCKSAEEVIRASNVIVTAISPQATAPGTFPRLFDMAWVKPGSLVLPVHTSGWNQSVIHDVDAMYTDDWSQFSSFVKPGLYDLPAAPTAELGEVVAGLKPGRTDPNHRIVDFNVGLAIHDMVFGDFIFQKAKKEGLGVQCVIADKMSAPLPKLE